MLIVMIKYRPPIILLIVSMLKCLICSSQEIENPIYNSNNIHSYIKNDTLGEGHSAVILYNKDSIGFKDERNAFIKRFSISKFYLVKINKLIGIDDLTTLDLPFNKDVSLKDVRVTVFTLEADKLIQQSYTNKDMITETVVKGIKRLKFSLPSVKASSVIYITYTYQLDAANSSAEYLDFDFIFQKDYPVISSYFQIAIPSYMRYLEISKNIDFKVVSNFTNGTEPMMEKMLTSTSFKKGYDNVTINGAIWRGTNLPGFNKEPFVDNFSNYRKELKVLVFLANGLFPENLNKANWHNYYNHFRLGRRAFSPLDTIKAIVKEIVQHKPNRLDSAKAIYYYVRDSIKCTNCLNSNGNVYSSRNYPAILTSKKGTRADKNILLTAMLRQAHLASLPLLISTKDNGRLDVNSFHYDIFNYVVSSLAINGEAYLLDASDGNNPFGTLDPSCYNGTAWLVSDSGKAVDISADLLNDRTSYEVNWDVSTNKDSSILIIKQKLGIVSSLKYRANYKIDTASIENELKEYAKSWPYTSELLNIEISNINQPDSNVVIVSKFKLGIKNYKDLKYFNPVFISQYGKNPLAAKERLLPLQFDHTSEKFYVFKMKMPKNIVVLDVVPLTHLESKNKDVIYKSEIQVDKENNMLYYSNVFKLRKTRFEAEEYDNIRNVFSQIAADQNQRVTLRIDNQND